jgi:hypothetical protein
MAARAVQVGDTVLQLTDAVALRKASEDSVWFISPAVAVRAQISMADALKLLDWKVTQTVPPG